MEKIICLLSVLASLSGERLHNQQQARCYSYSLSVFCPHPMYPLLLGFLHRAYMTFASCTRSFLSRYLRHLQAPIYILALLLNHMHIFYQSLYKFSIPRINPYLHTNLLRHPFSPQSYVIQHMSTCVAVHCIAWEANEETPQILFSIAFSLRVASSIISFGPTVLSAVESISVTYYPGCPSLFHLAGGWKTICIQVLVTRLDAEGWCMCCPAISPSHHRLL